jgi:hypothetical protein
MDEIAFKAGCHQHNMCDPVNPELDGWLISQKNWKKLPSQPKGKVL